MSQAAPHYYSLGESAVALALPAPATLAQQRRIWRLAASLAGAPGVLDIVPGMNNLTVSYHPLDFDPDHAFDCLRQHWAALGAADDDAPARQVDIPVCYGGEAGPDLAEVARHTGLTPAEVVKQHCAAEYQVFFMGFQPGFAYLGGLPEALATPRRAQPRTRETVPGAPSMVSECMVWIESITSKAGGSPLPSVVRMSRTEVSDASRIGASTNPMRLARRRTCPAASSPLT